MILKIIIVLANKKQNLVNNFFKKNHKKKNPKPYKNTLNCYFQIKIKIRFLLKTQFSSSKNHKLDLDRKVNSSFKTFKNQGSIPTLVLEFC